MTANPPSWSSGPSLNNRCDPPLAPPVPARPLDDPPHRAAPSRPHPAHPLGETARLRESARALACPGRHPRRPLPLHSRPQPPSSRDSHLHLRPCPRPTPPLSKNRGGASSLFPGRVPEPAPIYTPFTQHSPPFTQQNVAFTQSVLAAVPRNPFPLNHLPKITPGPAFFSPTLAAPRSQKTGGGAQLCPLRFAICDSHILQKKRGGCPTSFAGQVHQLRACPFPSTPRRIRSLLI